MSLIKSFLDENKKLSFKLLKEKLNDINLIVKDTEDLFIINYDSNTIDKNDPLMKDSRTIIFDKENYSIKMLGLKSSLSNEDFINKVSWNDLVIEESIDGTLINLYYYNDKWNVSTKKTLDAECYWNTSKTFKTLCSLLLSLIFLIKFNKKLGNNFLINFFIY